MHPSLFVYIITSCIKKNIKQSAILKLETEIGTKTGHEECSKYLENLVGQLLLHPVTLNVEAQEKLLWKVKEVFTEEDNQMLMKKPTKNEVKGSLWSAKMHTAPGSDGLTNFLYKDC